MASRLLNTILLLGLFGVVASGQQAELQPPGDDKPLPRPEVDGPSSFVTAAALSPDGKTLYVGGWDKVVHVYRLDGQGKFVVDRAATYRVPIGPEEGSLNCLALSGDGNWLAVAGNSLSRASMSFGNVGLWRKRIPPEVLRDRGTIYVFNTRTRAVKLLRGHEGTVSSLAFAGPTGNERPPQLVSAAQEWDDNRNDTVGSLRLWDVDKGVNLATVRDLPKSGVRPGLAVWQPAPQRIRAGVAWDDGTFRVWDVDKGGQGALLTAPDGKNNVTIAYLPDHDQVVTGSFAQQKGWLQGWKMPAGGGAPTWDKNMTVAFPPIPGETGTTFFFPRAGTLFAGKAGGPLDHAAVVLRTTFSPNKGQEPRAEEDRLQVVRIEKAGTLTPVLATPMVVARGGGTQPVVAASAGGRHLVVAGNRTHDVLVYGIDDLLKGGAQPQVLRGVAESIRYAGFVTKGKDRGLVLNTLPKEIIGAAPRAPAAGDMVFDFTNRKLLGSPAGWQTDAPATGGWKVIQKDKTILNSLGEKQASKITLGEGEILTDYAVLPGTPPLLALASHDLGRPQLALCNLQTGQMLLRLIGHTERIRSLAFSGDGKLLASAGEDQVVCVWTLADFARVLNRNGTIPGLRLNEDKQSLAVFEVQEGSPAFGKLKEGDVIEGIVEADKLKPTKTENEFFSAIWTVAPGKPVTVRTQKRGDVAITLAQGVETRNPLFSFFVTRGANADGRDWIGWTPVGPYDASRPEAERNLGWHINTGKAEAPTRFAEAGQYKKEYHRPDLLKYLVAKGKLDVALEEWDRDNKIKKEGKKLPEPQINLRLAEAGPDPLRKDGEVVVRQAPRTLRLAIDNFATDDVGAVTWTVAGLAADSRPFATGFDREWTADVSKLGWKRGSYKVRVEIQTQEDTPRKYTQDLSVRYQPPPPEVAAPTGRQVVDKAAFPFKAEVKPGAAGQDVQVRLIQRHLGKEILSEVQGNKIDRALKLEPGDNLIEVVAVNKDVPAEFQELETARTVLEVTYQPPVPDPQPIITLDSVTPQGSRSASALPIVPGRPIVVDTNKVVVRGKITATKNLTKGDWAKDKDAAKPLAKFEADKAKDHTIAQELTLVPGTQQFRFVAKTGKSEETEAKLNVVFRPPLPQVVLTAPQTGLIVYEGKDPANVEVRYQLVDFKPEHPFETTVLVNDKVDPKIQAVLDAKARTLSAKVPLAYGDNRIQVRLKNKYDVEEAAEDIVLVRYLRPPRIAKLTGPAESDKSLADLTATVESALPLVPVVDAEVSNASTGTRRRITTYAVEKGDKTWTVQLKDVPLEVGSNEVRLLVSNSDARALEPATQTVVYKKVPPPPAVVELVEPRGNVSVTEREMTFSFQVASKSPLRRLELVQQGAVQARQAIDVSKLKPNTDGQYELKLALKLAEAPGKIVPIDPTTLKANPQGFLEAATGMYLGNGTNGLRVEAVNEGGQTDTGVVVSLHRRPVELVIDRIDPRGGKGDAVLAEKRGEGQVAFKPVEQGRVMLQGRVRWDREKDDQLKEVNHVQVFVNGLRQPAVALSEPAGNVRERTFQAPLSLTAPTGKDNTIEVTLPGLKMDSSARQQFTVACKAPEAQRLHLLIVGVDEEDERGLASRVLGGLHADYKDVWETRRFKLPKFAEGRLYTPLVGYVRPGQVLTELRRIKDEIELLSRAGATSDVVMVYFAGKKAQQEKENYCLTSVSQQVPDLRRSALAFSSMESCLADTLGAQVMLLDVSRTGDTVGAGGGGNYLQQSRVGLVCYEWETTPPPSLQMPNALESALGKSATLGDMARELNQIAIDLKRQSLLCTFNITKDHQLNVMPIGVRTKQ